MLYKEYYNSALRHLDVCKIMLERLSSMDRKPKFYAKRERLLLDILKSATIIQYTIKGRFMNR